MLDVRKRADEIYSIEERLLDMERQGLLSCQPRRVKPSFWIACLSARTDAKELADYLGSEGFSVIGVSEINLHSDKRQSATFAHLDMGYRMYSIEFVQPNKK